MERRATDLEGHKDPLTGEPGARPIGVGLGSTAGSAVGAAIGAIAGPAGIAAGVAVAGAVVGGIAGGYAAKSAANSIDPTIEDRHWAANFRNASYVTPGAKYKDYQPAYRYGWESRATYRDVPFDEIERDLAEGWSAAKGESPLAWEDARFAVRDAWSRVDLAARPRSADKNF